MCDVVVFTLTGTVMQLAVDGGIAKIVGSSQWATRDCAMVASGMATREL